jgi:hypothetical protein
MQKVLSGFMRPASGRVTSSIPADLVMEGKLDKSCQDAFAAVKEFENSRCLSVQSMGAAYTAARPGLVMALLGLQSKLGLRDDVVHDAVLLMDRAVSASCKVCATGLGKHACCALVSAVPAGLGSIAWTCTSTLCWPCPAGDPTLWPPWIHTPSLVCSESLLNLLNPTRPAGTGGCLPLPGSCLPAQCPAGCSRPSQGPCRPG